MKVICDLIIAIIVASAVWSFQMLRPTKTPQLGGSGSFSVTVPEDVTVVNVEVGGYGGGGGGSVLLGPSDAVTVTGGQGFNYRLR